MDSYLVITNLKKGVRSVFIPSLALFHYYLEEILLRPDDGNQQAGLPVYECKICDTDWIRFWQVEMKIFSQCSCRNITINSKIFHQMTTIRMTSKIFLSKSN